jgi:hypothetical protein
LAVDTRLEVRTPGNDVVGLAGVVGVNQRLEVYWEGYVCSSVHLSLTRGESEGLVLVGHIFEIPNAEVDSEIR